MKYLLFLMLIPTLLSCDENNKHSKPVDKVVDTVDTPATAQAALAYYKCDYLKKNFDTILSAGGNVNGEVWGIDRNDISKLPLISLNKIDTNAIIKIAETHLRNRFDVINLEFFNFEVQKIGKGEASVNPRARYIIVSFLFDKRGYYQLVPVLLDGKIVLSDQE